MKLFYLFCILSTILFVYSLPIQLNEPSSSSSIIKNNDINEEVQPDCNNGDINYNVKVDDLVEQITTHWKFDHLDTIQSMSNALTSSQIKKHIQIYYRPKMYQQNEQHQIIMNPSSLLDDDNMDTKVLIAQIFDAIQSHTQGKMAALWDRLGDKLGKQTLETYLRKIISDTCGPSSTYSLFSSPSLSSEEEEVEIREEQEEEKELENEVLDFIEKEDEEEDEEDEEEEIEDLLLALKKNQQDEPPKKEEASVIHSQCLYDNADQLSSLLDRYIGNHLMNIFSIMDEEELPDLLDSTIENLNGVLDYFNKVFLGDSQHELFYQSTEWKGSVRNTWLNTILPKLNKNSLHHSTAHFFTRYTCLAKV
ncbi:unnamed protein product [Cunninghamella blakesleeana]